MTENLEHMFQTLTNQLKEVKKEIEKWYDHFTATDRGIYPQCCVINGTYSPKFRTKVPNVFYLWLIFNIFIYCLRDSFTY